MLPLGLLTMKRNNPKGAAVPRGSALHPRSENGVPNSILTEMRDVASLVPNPDSESFYGTRDDDQTTLLASIARYGVLSPLIVCGNQVQAGNRRLKAAMELGMEQVPVVQCTDPFDLARIVASQQSRIKSPSLIIKELSILDEVYDIKQGSRSDLRREVLEEVQKLRLNIAGSQGAMANLRKIKRLADSVYMDNPKGWDKFLNKMDSGELSVSAALKKLTAKHDEQVRERHPHLISRSNSECSIFNRDSFDFEGVEDASVQLIVTSPPYFKMRDYQIGPNQLGQESTPEIFASRLANFLNQAKRVLRPDGSLFVNLGDQVIDGTYTMSPYLFALEMKRIGWILNDELVWIKTNGRPGSTKRTIRSHESFFHFVLNPDFKYFQDGLSGVQKYPGRVKNSTIITSSAASDQMQRAKICEDKGVPYDHTATFPEYIPLVAIQLTTEPGDLVLDPFMGAGTTGIVCHELKRDFVGFELNPNNFLAADTLLTHYRHISTRPTGSPQTGAEHGGKYNANDEFAEVALQD